MPGDRQLIIICLLALVVTQVSIPEVVAAALGTRVRIEPADLVVRLNETFVVQVVIEEADNLGAFQFNLVYDPSILQVTEAALSTFLESTGNSMVPMGPEVNNAEGKVIFVVVSFGSAPGPSGTGVLATITCVAQGEGSSDLGLREVQVLDTAASAQWVTVEGGQVVVRGTAAPTPAATTTPGPAATATPIPMPTSTPEAVDTPPPAATASPSPTPIATSSAAATPTEAPPSSPAPMPSVSIAPTETKPTEVTTPMAVPTTEAIQAPATPTTVPTWPPATPAPPSPSPTPLSPSPMLSPTPLATIPVSAATGPSVGAALGLIVAALAVATLAVFILSRRPGV